MSVVVAFDPDIRSVVGGLLGRIVVYSVLAKITGHCRKLIGSSNKGSRIKYDNLSKFATTQPKNPSPSTEASAVTQYKDVNKNQNNNNNSNNTIDKEDKKK
ncbi:MAG: hypothetical protein WAM88_02095 [Nitrososphaeraceae archaeon]